MASDKMEAVEWMRQPKSQKSNMAAQTPPIPPLLGEHQLLLSKTSDGSALVTNFRFCVCEFRSFINVPLMMIWELTVMETAKRLRIACKDGATYVCTFATQEDCRQCAQVLKDKSGIPRQLMDIFAYRFYYHANKKDGDGVNLTSLDREQIELCQPLPEHTAYSFGKEVERLGFDCNKQKIWKMSHANESFEFCPTYPKYHILPATVDNDKLKNSTDFRAGKRFPSVVWRDKSSGVVLIRSSQPLPSFLGLTYYSNEADVFLLEEIVKACNREQQLLLESKISDVGTKAEMNVATDSRSSGHGDKADNSHQTSSTANRERHPSKASQNSSSSSSSSPSSAARGTMTVNGHTELNGASPQVEPAAPNHPLAIVDCRSLAMVWGNSLKGGGTEDESLYKCNIIHLDLANIHTVRDSFCKLNNICHSYQDGSYYKALSGCMWLNYISSLLKGANSVVRLMHVDKRPVLVHCSDGWDRTAQIVSLSELMMDPYYRTIEGFQVLVEREWLAFGHKFGERGGHDPNCTDRNQQSPIFLQFLDCVYQLTLQYPSSFQFNEAYLVKLLKHSQACLFGNFLHNCDRERERCQYSVASVWSLLKSDNPQFLNLLYKDTDQVITAHCGEHEVVLWTSVYMAGQSPSHYGSTRDFSVALASNQEGDEDGNEGFSRSRSMDDLSKASVGSGRRNSDPNLAQTPDSATPTTVMAAPIHDTSSSSAEILQLSDSPPSYGFHTSDEVSPSEVQSSASSSRERRAAQEGLSTPLRSSPSSSHHSSTPDSGKRASPPSKNSPQTGREVPATNGTPAKEEDEAHLSVERMGIDDSPNGGSEDLTTAKEKSPAVALDDASAAAATKRDCEGESSFISNGSSGSSHPSPLASHSSTHSSPSSPLPLVQEEKLTSLLSERLAQHSEVNGVASPSFHSNSRQTTPTPYDPSLESATIPSSQEERKIQVLKQQAQQNLLAQGPRTKSPSSSSSDSSQRSVRPGNDASRMAAAANRAQGVVNEHSTEDNAANGGLNSKSTDTLVGDLADDAHSSAIMTPLDITTLTGPEHHRQHHAGGTVTPALAVPMSTSASSNGLRMTSSPNGGATAPIPSSSSSSRRTRTASGTSMDASLSPACVCRGHWSDTGRLRHPSGGDASIRRWNRSSVSTSTTDISDSCIGKVSPPATERQAGMRQLLDVDGLTFFSERRHQLLIDLVTEKDNKISSLEVRLKQAIDTIRASRNAAQMSQQQAATMDELLLTDTEGGEFSSLGALSNPASDASWEQVDEAEEGFAMWMPDEAVTHCAACDNCFWFAQRKHHCRNCGKIFCSKCSSFMAPMAGIYHKEPQRVCGRCHSRLMQLSPGASCDGRIPTMVADG